MNRKSFLYLLGNASVALIPFNMASCGPSEGTLMLSRPGSLLKLSDEADILSAGRDYLLAHPEEQDRKQLVGLLTSGTGEGFTNAMLQEQIEREYREGLTVVADGWVLSQTEARQCALYYIINS